MNLASLHACIIAVLALVIVAGRACGDRIVLKRTVRLERVSEVVRLGDVAELHGPDALAFADLEVARVDGRAPALRLEIGDIRRTLSAAGAHWGRLDLCGGTVDVEVAAGPTTPLAMEPASLTDRQPRGTSGGSQEPPWTVGSTVMEQPTMEGHVVRFLAQQLHRSPAEVRLRFRSPEPDILRRPAPEVRFEVQPHGNLTNDVVDMTVRVWHDDRILSRWVVRADLEVLTEVVSAPNDVRRDLALDPSSLDRRGVWMTPRNAAQVATVEDVAGAALTASLEGGTPLEKRHLRHEPVIRRGDQVMVRCVVGGLVVSMKAEARSAGAVGDTIELRKPGEREAFAAVVNGPGEALVSVKR